MELMCTENIVGILSHCLFQWRERVHAGMHNHELVLRVSAVVVTCKNYIMIIVQLYKGYALTNNMKTALNICRFHK